MGKKAVVIGAGVSGLTTALLLLEKNFEVTIVAKHIPGDLDPEYASPFAGANWNSTTTDPIHQELDKVAYLKFWELAKLPNTGIKVFPNFKVSREFQLVNGELILPWFKDFVHGFRLLNKDELPKGEDFVAGYKYDTVTISTNIYLNYLLQEIFKKGGVLKRKNLKHINEAYGFHHSGERADVIINSTGLLARFLGGVEDQDVYPIRGQILWVRNNSSRILSVKFSEEQEASFYSFPRGEGGCIIGGTFSVDNWSTVPEPELTKQLVKWAKKYLPELVDPSKGNDTEIDIVRENVGLRPARKGGYRLEREGSIIHYYGIGKSGYQSSFGLSGEVVKLTEEWLSRNKL